MLKKKKERVNPLEIYKQFYHQEENKSARKTLLVADINQTAGKSAKYATFGPQIQCKTWLEKMEVWGFFSTLMLLHTLSRLKKKNKTSMSVISRIAIYF